MIFSKELKLIIGTFFIFILLAACGGESKTTPKASAAKINTTTPKAAATAPATSQKVIIGGKDMTVKSGEEFCMDVKVSNFVDIVSMQYSTNWDAKALAYKGVKSFNLEDLSVDSFGKSKEGDNSLRFLWFKNDLKPVALFNDATIYQTCFKAIGKSGTTTQVNISNKPITVEVVNSKYKKVAHEIKPATITIE